jgi:hypothetical protein
VANPRSNVVSCVVCSGRWLKLTLVDGIPRETFVRVRHDARWNKVILEGAFNEDC